MLLPSEILGLVISRFQMVASELQWQSRTTVSKQRQGMTTILQCIAPGKLYVQQPSEILKLPGPIAKG